MMYSAVNSALTVLKRSTDTPSGEERPLTPRSLAPARTSPRRSLTLNEVRQKYFTPLAMYFVEIFMIDKTARYHLPPTVTSALLGLEYAACATTGMILLKETMNIRRLDKRALVLLVAPFATLAAISGLLTVGKINGAEFYLKFFLVLTLGVILAELKDRFRDPLGPAVTPPAL